MPIVEERWPGLRPGHDSVPAAEAGGATGRRILCGDFRTLDLGDVRPTLIVGNPPYKMKVLDAFLGRAEGLLPDGGRCGFLLSSYQLQTPGTVLRWNDDWGLEGHMVPRALFPRSRWPLIFCLFGRRRTQVMTGFALYREAQSIHHMPRPVGLLPIHGAPRRSCWRAIVEWALGWLGGRASVADFCDAIGPAGPRE